MLTKKVKIAIAIVAVLAIVLFVIVLLSSNPSAPSSNNARVNVVPSKSTSSANVQPKTFQIQVAVSPNSSNNYLGIASDNVTVILTNKPNAASWQVDGDNNLFTVMNGQKYMVSYAYEQIPKLTNYDLTNVNNVYQLGFMNTVDNNGNPLNNAACLVNKNFGGIMTFNGTPSPAGYSFSTDYNCVIFQIFN